MGQPKPIKRQKARNAEYYDMQRTQDTLYKRSLNSQNFVKLMDIIRCDENIMLAYRNIKRNGGSQTPGVDGRTIEHFEKLSPEKVVQYVRKRLDWYVPQPVKRVEIPKGDGKTRPLGIPTIADRIIQQCFLQVLEPICEAKFHDRSYGFRPLRSAQNAMAVLYKLIQQMDLHYVVDVDIKGFFDNISHGKLLKQMWALGIRDKKVLSIISAMLKAEVAEIGFPEKGTPQGGIISPLLANIVLNELDWWVSDQWQTFETIKQYTPQKQQNGTMKDFTRYTSLRNYSNLKEGWLVRYADDFKIVCRNSSDAKRWFYAVEACLKERLGLDISPDKSKIVSLKKNYSEFLGLKVKATRKGNKPKCKTPAPRYVVKSHIRDKTLQRITKTAQGRIHDVIYAGSGDSVLRAVGRYNAFVIGVHNYYQMATHVTNDVNRIDYQVFRTLEKRTHTKLKRYEDGRGNQYIKDRYGKSSRMKSWHGLPIVPISYVQTVPPLLKRVAVNQYTPEGRETVHKNLTGINLNVLYYMMRNPVQGESIEYNDNRLSLFCGQYGKCAITGAPLEIGDIHCHHIIHRKQGGSDRYENLLLVKHDVHTLLHAVDSLVVTSLLETLNLTAKQKAKLNYLRAKAGLMGI